MWGEGSKMKREPEIRWQIAPNSGGVVVSSAYSQQSVSAPTVWFSHPLSFTLSFILCHHGWWFEESKVWPPKGWKRKFTGTKCEEVRKQRVAHLSWDTRLAEVRIQAQELKFTTDTMANQRQRIHRNGLQANLKFFSKIICNDSTNTQWDYQHMVSHLRLDPILHTANLRLPRNPASIWLSKQIRHNRLLDILLRCRHLLSIICNIPHLQ